MSSLFLCWVYFLFEKGFSGLEIIEIPLIILTGWNQKMSDEKIDIGEVEDAKKKLESVKTEEHKAEMKAVLKCGNCGAIQDFPAHCGVAMDFDEDKMTCSACGESDSVPEHCGAPMKPALVSL